MQVAEDLLQAGHLDTADKFIQVMDTGKLEHMTEPVQTEQNNIDSENEMLRRAEKPLVIATDNPVKHITCHMTLLDDPEIRASKPDVVQATLAHVAEHLTDWTSLSANNPAILMLKNVPPIPQSGMPGAPLQAPQGGMPNREQPVEAQNPKGPNLPGLPKNPLTGEPPPVGPQQISPLPQT